MSEKAIREVFRQFLDGQIGVRVAVSRMERLARQHTGLVVGTAELTARERARWRVFERAWIRRRKQLAEKRLAEIRRLGGLIARVVQAPKRTRKSRKRAPRRGSA